MDQLLKLKIELPQETITSLWRTMVAQVSREAHRPLPLGIIIHRWQEVLSVDERAAQMLMMKLCPANCKGLCCSGIQTIREVFPKFFVNRSLCYSTCFKKTRF